MVSATSHKVLGGYLKGAGWAMPLPFTLGYDFSGTIHEIDDANASKYPIGTSVFGVQWGQGKHDEDDKPCGGTFAQYVAVPTSRLSIKPYGLSHEAAAASSLVGTTAHQITFECANVKKGDKVLILGGPTSVGMIAVQLAVYKPELMYILLHHQGIKNLFKVWVKILQLSIIVPRNGGI